MNAFIEKVATGASRAFYRSKLVVSKHSPEILMGVGTIAIVSGVVLACKSTLKVEEVLDEDASTKEKIAAAASSNAKMSDGQTYTEEMAKHDNLVCTAKTGLKLVKMYAPSVALIGGGITCFFVAHGILHKRNLALAAAYNALSAEYLDYQKRVADAVGEDVETRIRSGLGKATEDCGEIKKGDDIAIGSLSNDAFSVYFEPGNPYYNKEDTYNVSFITCQETTANRIINRHGHIFLNEIYDMYGLPHTKAGAVVGWLADADNKNGRANYVDISVKPCWKCAATGEVENHPLSDVGWYRAYLIEFNHPYLILDSI